MFRERLAIASAKPVGHVTDCVQETLCLARLQAGLYLSKRMFYEGTTRPITHCCRPIYITQLRASGDSRRDNCYLQPATVGGKTRLVNL